MGVRIPMMPKGVEHLVIPDTLVLFAGVRIPMMPKGVEHVPLVVASSPRAQ